MVKICKKTIKEDFETAILKGSKRRKYLLKKLIINIIDDNFEKVQRFVEAGAEVNGVDNLGLYPLTYDVGTGDITMIDFLVEKGADVTLGFEGKSPLVFAMLYNPLYTGILKRFGAKF